MKRKSKLMSLLLSLVLMFSLFTGITSANAENDAKTITVGSEQTYTTIQKAINAIYEEEDPTGWTIIVESGTYLQFAVPKELDGLTVKAATDATVKITTWTGEYDSALTAEYNSTKSSNSYYNTQGYQYVFNSVYVQAENVTFSGLNFTLGTYMPTEGQYWYRACITDLGGYANGNTMSTGLTVTNCTFSSNQQGYVTTYPTGFIYNAYGILIGASTSWSITGCSFEKFSSAISFMCDGYSVDSQGIIVTGNEFTNCDRAMDGYYGGTPTDTAGTLTFSNNTVIGSEELRSKIVVMDQASKGSIGKVSITDNTITNTMVLMENMDESSCEVNDILKDNTFNKGSYFVQGDGWYYNNSYNGTITVDLPDMASYESPSDSTGYWTLNVNADTLGSNVEGATNYINQVIAEANASGSHTLSFTWLDTDEPTLLGTVTAFKDVIYWQGVDSGDLAISKEVKGTTTDDEFEFNIKLDTTDADVTTETSVGTYNYTLTYATVDQDGNAGNNITFVPDSENSSIATATVSLKAGESITIQGLPAGATYTVTETTAKGYTTSSTGATGTIVKDETQTASFINAKTGGLTVKKEVSNNTDDDTTFTFTVTLDDTTVNGIYGEMEFVDGEATFTLKAGESKTATDLIAGIGYTVTESETDGYSISSSTGDTGTIVADTIAECVIINTLDETETPTDPTTPDDSTPTTPSEPDGSTPSETATPTTSTETTPSTSTTETSANDATTETVETNVKTGDSANIALYALILIIAMFGIVTIRRTYKKKQ